MCDLRTRQVAMYTDQVILLYSWRRNECKYFFEGTVESSGKPSTEVELLPHLSEGRGQVDGAGGPEHRNGGRTR